MPETKSYESIAANVAAVRENMRQAAEAAGRDPQDITLVAATKVQTSDTIRNAIRAGITICGENRVQELVAHLEDNAYEGAKVHFIGHLQPGMVYIQNFLIRNKDLRHLGHILIYIFSQQIALVLQYLGQNSFLFFYGLSTIHRTIVHATHT